METSDGDLGLHALDRVFRDMAIDEPWTVREPRGFTWWGAWLRQRVWAEPAVDADGDRLWHVRARTPALLDQPDEPEAYALVGRFNAMAGLSAYVYDAGDATISARCGAFVYGDAAPFLERFFVTATALQASLAFAAVSIEADGRPLDDAPHPVSGPRPDPDDMLRLAGRVPVRLLAVHPDHPRPRRGGHHCRGPAALVRGDRRLASHHIPDGDAGAVVARHRDGVTVMSSGGASRLRRVSLAGIFDAANAARCRRRPFGRRQAPSCSARRRARRSPRR